MTATIKTNTTFLDIIRSEGQKYGHSDGFKYIMSYFGTFEDFQNGNIHYITLAPEKGPWSSFSFIELIQKGMKQNEIYEIFTKIYRRKYTVKQITLLVIQEAWEKFKESGKIKLIGKSGGKVTYSQLENGKSQDEIEEIFNLHRKKSDNMQQNSGRFDTFHELLKMIKQFTVSNYQNNTRVKPISIQFEKFTNSIRPVKPTGFCVAVERMMTLVSLCHKTHNAEEKELKKQQRKKQKNIAHNKHATKYNTLKAKLGLEKFNQKKSRDQAAKNALKFLGSDITAQFVKWRTESAHGKSYDMAPTEENIISFPKFTVQNYKHLGYTSRKVLAEFVETCLNDLSSFSNMTIKFHPDCTIAKAQLYQYAALTNNKDYPTMVRKTRDVDTNRVFKICGMYKCKETFYIQPDNAMGEPMSFNVYMSLPKQWQNFERWSGFGIMGNPQHSTLLNILLKIVDCNIEEFGFVTKGQSYKVSYTSNTQVVGRFHAQKNISQLFSSIITPAKAAAAAAEKDRQARASQARANQARANSDIFQMFFGDFGKSPPKYAATKAKLAEKLANGEIDMETFSEAFGVLE